MAAHIRMREGLLFTADRQKLVNPATGRDVAVGGRAANAALRRAGLLPLGRLGGPAPLTAPVGPVIANGALRTQRFRLVHPTAPGSATIAPTALAIALRLEQVGAAGRGAVIHFENRGGERISRTVYGLAPRLAQDIQRISEGKGENLAGSDQVADGYSLVATEFEIRSVVQPGGGKKQGSYKTRETPLFKLADYKCRPGDCLLAALREVSEHPPPEKRNEALRRRLRIPPGPISIEHIEALAEAFSTAIEVLTGAIDITREFDDRVTNCCHASARPIVLRASLFPYPTTLQVLLENPDTLQAHYSRVMQHKKLALCPVTGDVLGEAPLTALAMRARVLAQGRAWKPTGVAKPKKAKSVYKQHVLVFDFETVWDDSMGMKVRPYSVGWFSFPRDEPPEDFTQCAAKVSIVYGLGTCQRDLLDYILAAPADVAYTLVSYNGSRFDHFILAEEAQRRERLTQVFWAGNSLRDLRIGRHKTLDICRLCPGQSLAGACKGFCTSPQKVEGFQHSIPQDAFLQGGEKGLVAWLTENSEACSKYLETDVLCTADLCCKLTSAVAKLSGVDPLKSSAGTAGGVAWKALSKTVSLPRAAPDEETDRFFRRAMTGGRTQNFMPRGFSARGAYRMVDVKSEYPTVMAAKNAGLFDPRLHYGRFPTSPPIATPGYVPGKVGIYRVTVKRQPAIKILPRRVEGEPLDWACEEEFEAHTSSCSIELIRMRGGEVEVHEGFYFETDTSGLFIRFLGPLFAEKDAQDAMKEAEDPRYNPAMREVVKILMNSCSGKTAQRNFDDWAVLAKGSAEQLHAESHMRGGRAEWFPLQGETCILVGKKKEEDVYKPGHAKPSQLAVLIYEYARTYLYELLLKDYKPMYCDTDSCLMALEDYERFRHDFPALDARGQQRKAELGDLEEELGTSSSVDVVLIAPKSYLVAPLAATGELIAGKTKAKMKGVNLGRDKLWVSGPDPESLELMQLHRSYTDETEGFVSLGKDPRPLFKTLSGFSEAKLICSQMTRSLKAETGFDLRQRYLVKSLEGVSDAVGVIGVGPQQPARLLSDEEFDALIDELL